MIKVWWEILCGFY